jgi:hypothetical protein
MPSLPCLRRCLVAAAVAAAAASSSVVAADPPATGPSDDIVPIKKARIIIAEDFESTAVGGIPAGYTKKGAVGVVGDVAHTGTKSLRLDAAVNGARQIIKQGEELTTLGGQHWGRLFFKVQLPSAVPPDGKIVHTTIVAGAAESPLAKDPIEVRLLGTLGNSKGTYQYLYNVQPRKGRKEFGPSTKSIYHYADGWVLAEWYVDYATQTYRCFIDGHELTALSIKKGENNFAGAEIPPVFESLSFGWCNYQPVVGTGFVAWIDDIALGKDRIGDQTLLPVAGAGK